jgi:hypothetical protein
MQSLRVDFRWRKAIALLGLSLTLWACGTSGPAFDGTPGAPTDGGPPDAAEPGPVAQCDPGSYVTSHSSGEPHVCSACPSGHFSSASNAPTCAVWTSCPPGTVVKGEGSASADRTCAPCGPDTESKTPNQTTCTPVGTCKAGTAHRPGGGPNDCDLCPVGTYCAGGGAPKVDCGNGTWDHDSDSSTACALATQCLKGERVFDDVTPVSDRQCTACTSGTFSASDNAASCAEWTTCMPGTRVSQAGT